jgi:very-short-patch-repair endonuclease
VGQAVKQTTGEILLEKHLRELKIPFEAEYRFHPQRRWRFDFFLPEHRIAIEVEGGTWTRGRHVRGKGFESDLRKMNEATKMGIRVFKFTTNMVERAESKTFLRELFQ